MLMKNTLLSITAVFITFILNAQNVSIQDINIEDQESFSIFVCSKYYNSRNLSNSIEAFEIGIMRELDLDENHPNRKAIIGMILNKYHDIIICGKDTENRLRDIEPIIKRSIGRGEYDLIDNLMYYEEDYGYNLNHYEIVDGNKETILDYIEKILNTPSLINKYDADRLIVLHNDFIEYEAKRGIELE